MTPTFYFFGYLLEQSKFISFSDFSPFVFFGVIDLTDAAALKLRSSYGFVSQQKRPFRQPVMNHEIRLPQEWTY